MITKNIIQFLKDIETHNDRVWFTAHKDEFLLAKADFERFVAALIENMSKFDPSLEYLNAKDCIFRIYRDARFSKNKSPYKTNF